MQKQIVPFVLLGGIFIAFIAAFHPLQTAHAKTCYDANQQVVPCPEDSKKKRPTDVPPVPTVDAGIAVPPGGNPAPGTGGLPFSPWLLGLGGVLIGILLGLLPRLGSFFDRSGGNNPRGVTYPIDRPGGDGDKDKAAFDAFLKFDGKTPGGPGNTGGDPHEVRFIIDKPAPDGPLGPGGGGDDLVSERDVPETPPGSPRPEPQPRLDGFDTEMNKGGDLVSERDVPETPPGSPRPEPQPRLDGTEAEGLEGGGGTPDGTSLPKVKTKPGGGPATDGPGFGGGAGEVSAGGQTWSGSGSEGASSAPHVKPGGGGPASDGPGSGVGGE